MASRELPQDSRGRFPAGAFGEASRKAVLLLLLLSLGTAWLGGCAGELPPPAESPGYRTFAPPPPAKAGGTARGAAAVRPPEIVQTRFVRVLVWEGAGEIVLEASEMRVWNRDGRLVAEVPGTLRLSAVGERIRCNRTKLLGDALDVAGVPGLRLGGGHVGGRLRIMARRGRLLAVAVVPLETYVAAVVSREMPPRFHPEALAAQAVAVRTYVVKATRNPRDPDYDVAGGVEDQVFEGTDNVAVVFRRAAEETRGLVVWYRGELARTVYHSTCGGRTEAAADAWGKDVPYLRSEECDACRESPFWRWEYRMSAAEGRRVAQSLGVPPGSDLRFTIEGRTPTGRAKRVRIASGMVSREIPASAFRKAEGYARVRSLKMEIVPVPDGWLITGAGYGHGVGMCQFGANGLAKAGRTFREILSFYYPGTVVAGEPP